MSSKYMFWLSSFGFYMEKFSYGVGDSILYQAGGVYVGQKEMKKDRMGPGLYDIVEDPDYGTL
jgi:hypothetical protein